MASILSWTCELHFCDEIILTYLETFVLAVVSKPICMQKKNKERTEQKPRPPRWQQMWTENIQASCQLVRDLWPDHAFTSPHGSINLTRRSDSQTSHIPKICKLLNKKWHFRNSWSYLWSLWGKWSRWLLGFICWLFVPVSCVMLFELKGSLHPNDKNLPREIVLVLFVQVVCHHYNSILSLVL